MKYHPGLEILSSAALGVLCFYYNCSLPFSALSMWASKKLEYVTHSHANDCWLLQSLLYASIGLCVYDASEE